MKRFLRHLIAAILCRCPNCWEPLACKRHWVGNIEGYSDYYCPKCSDITPEEGQDVYD